MYRIKVFIENMRSLAFSMTVSPVFLDIFRDSLFITSFAAILGVYTGYVIYKTFLDRKSIYSDNSLWFFSVPEPVNKNVTEQKEINGLYSTEV